MSIFKETFPKYIRSQLEVRKKILSKGNKGDSRFEQIEDNNIAIDPGAFFTLTTSKQCVIRMSSGVDLRDWRSILEPEELRIAGYKAADKEKGTKESAPTPMYLAKQYVLEGFHPHSSKIG